MIIFAILFLYCISFAQPVTTTVVTAGGTGGEVIYIYLSDMDDDSLASLYSAPIDMTPYWNDNWITNDFSYVVYANSAADTPYANISIAGRMAGGSESSWVDVDTIYTSGTEGTFKGLFDMDDIKFDQIRVEIDGLTNNREDATFKIWLVLNKRGDRAFRP